MVSDAMAKIVFLSVPVFGGVFPVRKVSFWLFFTVKYIFLKIKLWPKESALEKEKEAFKIMKKLDVLAAALVIIGAVNWGLAGAFHLDLVAAVFGMKFGETSALSTVVYSLVGLAGLYQALTWKSIQRRWHGDLSGARA
jgi:uncharacterized membrane protein YuzA (DUF378 family)